MSSTKVETREAHLTEVVENHRGRLLSIIGKMIRDEVEAEDVLQDVFAEFVETYDMGQAIETLGGWLVRVAQNKIRDRFRRKKTQENYNNDLMASAEESFSIDNAWMQDRFRKELIEALMVLSQEQRDIFIMNELEGKSFEEVSSITGVNINTLLARKRQAVLTLREYLKEIYDELE